MSKSISISEMVSTLRSGMKTYGLSKAVIDTYSRRIRDLHEYMEINGIDFYSENIGDMFYAQILNNGNMPLSRKNDYRRSILMLNNIISGKPFSRARSRQHVTHTPPNTKLGDYVVKFLKVIKEQNYSNSTINSHERTLSFFAKAMMVAGVSVDNLTHKDIMGYIGSLQKGRVAMAISVRKFLSYLYAEKVISINLAKGLYRIKEFRSAPVLTFYTPGEVAMIENAVDRTSRNGKRDYAILLLASRLGLRASDIERLKFSDIDWDNNTISLVQYKTGRKITLPLLADVGNAIIDYVKNSRPKTNDIKEVFISWYQPYAPLTTLSDIATKYIRLSGIEVNGRHRGMHSLRHSLATALLNEGRDIHVISAALGHRTTESTMCYLGIDINNLLMCSMDVSLPTDDFYMQRGGIFYE